MNFAHPAAFVLLAPVAFAVWRMFRTARRRAAPFPLVSLIPAKRTLRQRIAVLPPVLFSAALVLSVIALAGPRSSLESSHVTKDSIAIEMTIDVSGTMQARDFRDAAHPRRTRLVVVKETFRDFIKRRPDDMVGLVAFGGYATTRCPLTLDHDALMRVLDATTVPGTDGFRADDDETMTSIGDGLAMACARLSAVTNVASRIVVLLSDGENNYGIVTPERAAAVASQQGVKVYVIGVGSNGIAPALVRLPNGVETTDVIRARIDERALRDIAERTGGRYYNVRTAGMLEDALAEIDSLEKTRIEETVYHHWNERFPAFLLPAVVLAAIAAVLGRI